jgi:hypothetical protein
MGVISGGGWAGPSTERDALSMRPQKNGDRVGGAYEGRTFKPSRCRCMGIYLKSK